MFNFQCSLCEFTFNKFLVNTSFHRKENIFFKLRQNSHSNEVEHHGDRIIRRQNNANASILNVVSSREFQSCDRKGNHALVELVRMVSHEFHHGETYPIVIDQGQVQENSANKPCKDDGFTNFADNYLGVVGVQQQLIVNHEAKEPL